ncbi:MAG: MFS transporter [Spirochaetales bacterium]|uniref:MFS transporter n=1 Tax=Candidatus Thalassospirochaeta sargassi TaxID=3119039 RepID=A0AAJ1MPT6_9SPIO|nr:MFS transporter [Spirochaetales bacterium]
MKSLLKLTEPYRGLRREIYIVVLSKTINAMGMLIFPFMALLLTRKIGLSNTEAGRYVAVMGLLWMPSSLIGGKLSDTFGRKRILITFEMLAVTAYTLCVFVEPSIKMIWILMTASFSFGVAGPSHDAMTADLTTKEQREGAYSLGYLGFNVGFAVAQILAGILFETHFHLMFLVDATTAFIALLMIAFFVREPLGSESSLEDDDINTENDESKKTIVSVLLSRPILIAFALAVFGYRFVYSQWSFLMPLHAEHNFPSEGAKLYGMLGFLNAVTVVTLTPILTAVFKSRTNIRRVFYAGILFTFGFGMLGVISFRAAFIISVFVFTIGEILEAVSTMPFIMNHTPASHRGRMSAVLPIIMGAGFSIGPLVCGAVLDIIGFRFTWGLAASVVAVSAVIMRILDIKDSKR